MEAEATKLLVGGISVSPDADEKEILKKAKDKMKRAGFSTSTLHFRLYKKSVDARKRDRIRLVCTVLAEGAFSKRELTEARLRAADAKLLAEEKLDPVLGSKPMRGRPLVVGMGPAGLFAALLLARNGYAPILIDRGASVEERVRDVEGFKKTGVLNPESNIQFGAGGAGTFSDGKLVTRIHDARCGFVLQTLCEFGAPEEILVKAKPHVGTDLLRGVVSSMLEEIERLGGEVRYHCRMDDFEELADGSLRIRTSCGDLACGAMILALGHSARDTYARLLEKNVAMEPKPISVGVRVEHLQRDMDVALYGDFAGHPNLGPAEYTLSDTSTGRGVYTFCMCPGGEVVAAASEEGGLVVNGMSNHARSGKNANAAVAVSVGCQDIVPVNGSAVLGAIAFQRQIERAAYAAGGGAYVAPVMTLGDFLQGKRGTEPSRILPSYRDGKVKVTDFEGVFPQFVKESLRYGFASFGKKIQGYDAPDAILTAAETRTSAPLRILRDAETMNALGHRLLYPCGEGAGYAGGITSAAVDGVRVALALMAHYAPSKER
ncbi:MAG: hypothetical protein IKJ35_06320 [Clostridia bacterium]|nr:hypothetical protein [Clostridia bacterium]